MERRKFITAISMLGASFTMPSGYRKTLLKNRAKLKVALVGTGVRGISFWGKRLVEEYGDVLEFVGLSDINPGRLAFGKSFMNVDCPTFGTCSEMLSSTNPDLLIVTTMDSTHHTYIIEGLNYGIDVLSEKPLTTDERKCQQILDAARRAKGDFIMGFNYRWSPYASKIKELISNGEIGTITSVDFHWYLNTYHGASYFRRWHGQREYGGTLWVHKSTHHFDLLNWWLDSDPEEVFAYGSLEHYGSNGPFRGNNCRDCAHTADCKFYWDITKSEHNMNLYVANEKHDGYIRDNCLFREEINIYDKMSAQIKYADKTIVNYSLTTYSPFEGYRVAFNGTDGRIEAWLDIPWLDKMEMDQEGLHASEMDQSATGEQDKKPIILHKNWNDYQVIEVGYDRRGHGGGDQRLQDKIFRDTGEIDPLAHAAGLRDGAMSILIGVAARKSIESHHPVRIAELTDLEPRARRI